MATVNVVLRKEEKDDKTFPLAIRIYKDGKSSYIYLDHSIEERYWNKKNRWIAPDCPNYKRLNNFLLKKLSEATDTSLELETSKEHVTAQAVTRKIRPRGGSSFAAQSKIYLDVLQTKKDLNRWSADKPRVGHFLTFVKGDIGFEQITPTLLKQYAAYLKDTRGISDRTIMNCMVVVRCIFRQAIDTGATEEKYYPFGKKKFRIKMPDTLKIGLIAKEIKQIEDADLTDQRLIHARNIFLFAFYFGGMRISDVFRVKWSDFKDNRLYYLMGKNDKGDSLKIPAKAALILDMYRRESPKHNLVFPDLESVDDMNDEWAVKRRIKSRTRRIGEYLDLLQEFLKIDKKLDPHIARHSFGNIAGKNITIKTLQKIYRHTHLSTTAGYQQNFTYEEMDNALDAVIGAV